MAGPGGSLRPTLNFWEEDPSAWERYLGTNLYGVYNCCYAFVPNMVEAKRGRVVTIVSDSGRIGDFRSCETGWEDEWKSCSTAWAWCRS